MILPRSAFLENLQNAVVQWKLDIEAQTIAEMAESMTFVQEFSQGLEGHFQRYGLSQGGFLILMLLSLDPPSGHTVVSLAERLGVRPPTMTGLTDTLQKQGLIERKSVPGDRRKYSIVLTRKGKKKSREILPDHFRRIQQAFGPLNDPEFLRLKRKVFNQMREAIKHLGGGLA